MSLEPYYAGEEFSTYLKINNTIYIIDTSVSCDYFLSVYSHKFSDDNKYYTECDLDRVYDRNEALEKHIETVKKIYNGVKLQDLGNVKKIKTTSYTYFDIRDKNIFIETKIRIDSYYGYHNYIISAIKNDNKNYHTEIKLEFPLYKKFEQKHIVCKYGKGGNRDGIFNFNCNAVGYLFTGSLIEEFEKY